MDAIGTQLNDFLVGIFNSILRLEEGNLRTAGLTNLSVTEMHVLACVEDAHDAPMGMAQIATLLGVTAGTLTASVKTLERKGYLKRIKDEKDRRRTLVMLTPEAAVPLRAHTVFHEQLVRDVRSKLTPEELNTFTQALHALHRYFTEMKEEQHD